MAALLALILALLGPTAGAAPYDEVRAAIRSGKPATAAFDALLEAEDRHVRDGLLLGTPDERRTRLEPLAASTSRVITAHLHHAPADRDLARVALRTVLRRKGQLVDAEYATRQAVRETADADGLALLDRLVKATRRLDDLARDPGAAPAALTGLRDEVDRLQRDLAAASRSFRAVAGLVEPIQVALTLDRRTWLVELVAYHLWDVETDTFGELHYAAYTLDRSGTILAADLGPADPIDHSVLTLRGALIARRAVAPLADDLRARVFGDLPWITRAERLVVAADGLLNHVPFEIVLAHAVDGEFHIPRVSYLTSGRERPHLGAWQAETTDPVVVFDVDYGAGGPWTPLPGTIGEGELVAAKTPGARVLRGAEATEAAILGLSRPRVLHVASHGFFAAQTDPERFDPLVTSRGLQRIDRPPAPVTAEAAPTGQTDHPALRSGLVFAGANEPESSGIVTAAEWSNLDLRGTRLVVLSACETGLGEIRNGDGVHGLRRALVLAGTQAQVLSLWKVDDAATAELMAAMYDRLAEGMAVGEALHRARRAIAGQPRFRHPFYWAAFTVSGREAVTLPRQEDPAEPSE